MEAPFTVRDKRTGVEPSSEPYSRHTGGGLPSSEPREAEAVAAAEARRKMCRGLMCGKDGVKIKET